MQKIYSKKELDDLFHKLPDIMQEFIVAPETAVRLEAIAEHHSIEQEKIPALGKETCYVLMGLISPEEFISNLALELEIPEEEIEVLFDDIQESLSPDLDAMIEKLGSASKEKTFDGSTPKPPQNLPTGAGLPSLIDNRLSGMMRMPKENIAVSSKPSLQPSPRPAQDTTTRTTPEGIVSGPQKPTYSTDDPYREKI